MNPYQVVKDFERALGEYTGAPYVVTVNSCTAALLLACAWHLRGSNPYPWKMGGEWRDRMEIQVPKRTYVSVPMSIIHAGGRPTFRDENWEGMYQLKPLPVYDSARWFTEMMYSPMFGRYAPNPMLCVSFHWSKTLGIQQGGAILLDDYNADQWLRRARFDGRTERVPASLDRIEMVGHHCYMSPEIAAEGLMRLSILPKKNDPLPNDDYPDLSTMEIFR